MPDERKWLERVYANWPDDGDNTTSRALACVRRALRACPRSAALWVARGRIRDLRYTEWLMTLVTHSDRNRNRFQRGIVDCYVHAIDLDPTFALAHEALAFFLYTRRSRMDMAEAEFRNALSFNGFEVAHVGLAKVLVELDRADEAIEVLRKYAKTKKDKPAILADLARDGYALFPLTKKFHAQAYKG